MIPAEAEVREDPVAGTAAMEAENEKEEEEDGPGEGGPERGIWDLSREETPGRHRSAVDVVWRAYMNDSIAHGFAPAAGDPCLMESLSRVEEHLERTRRTPESAEFAASCDVEKKEEEPMSNEPEEIQQAIVECVRTRGALGLGAIAEACSISPATASKYLKMLVREGRVFHGGNRRSSRYAASREALGAPGAPPEACPRRATAPRAKKAKDADDAAGANGARPTLADLSRAPAGSGKRFTVRLGAAEVDCESAADVAELVRALRDGG